MFTGSLLFPAVLQQLLAESADPLAPHAPHFPGKAKRVIFMYMPGGVSHVERDFEKVLVEVDGTVSEGIKVVTIHWKKRTCVASETSIATGKK